MRYKEAKQRTFSYLVHKLTSEYDPHFVETFGSSDETGSELKWKHALYAVSITVVAGLHI